MDPSYQTQLTLQQLSQAIQSTAGTESKKEQPDAELQKHSS